MIRVKIKSILLFVFLLCFSVGTLFSQQFQYQEIAKAFQYGNFKKCYKLAEKENKANPQSTLPYIYMAISLYEGQEEKALMKLHPNPLASSLDYLKKGKEYLNEEDKIPPTFVVSLKAIQKEAIRPIKNDLKAGKFPEAKQKSDAFTTLFDNSSILYFNYSTTSIVNYCNDLLTGNSEETKTNLVHFSIEASKSAITRLINGENSNISLRELQRIQNELFELLMSCIEIKQTDLADPISKTLLEIFDNRSDKYRNYYFWDLFQLGLVSKKELLASALYKNMDPGTQSLSDSAYQFEEWKDPFFLLANTGQNANYLTQKEKNILYIVNLCRMNPKLFAATYLEKYIELNPEDKGSYASSLKRTLKKMESLPPYQPDSIIFLAAQLHAKDYGEKGKEGHGGLFGNPEGRMTHFGAIGEITAENCDYGTDLATEIVLHLLVDNGISGVGHRKNLLAPDLRRIGISVQPHSQYGINCVMDFMD